MKVLLTAPLSPYSGYGNDGIGMARALIRWGADVYLQPSAVQSPLPEDIAQLLTKTLVAPFDLHIVHIDPIQLDVSPEAKISAGMTIGWTMWEYSNFKNLQGRSTFRKRLNKFDAIVAYDQVTAAGLREYTSSPVIVQQGGFWPEDWPEVHRDWYEDRFAFAMVGVLSERKDPFVAISAFQQLKAEYPEEFEPAELHLKTVIPGLHSSMEQWIPKLKIHYEVWNSDKLHLFYENMNCLLAPSRGEGKNMPALEFQSTGGVVIATDWGGHQEWRDDSYNYGIAYELQPVSPDFPLTLNARASVEDLKATMLHVFRNREEAKRKGALAAQIIPQMCSWDAVIEKLFLKLKGIEGGDKLWTSAVSVSTPKEED